MSASLSASLVFTSWPHSSSASFMSSTRYGFSGWYSSRSTPRIFSSLFTHCMISFGLLRSPFFSLMSSIRWLSSFFIDIVV